jgi:hypothetical protein
MKSTRLQDIRWRKEAVFDANTAALQTKLERVAHPLDTFGECIKLPELRGCERFPACTEWGLGTKPVEKCLYLLQREPCLLREA